jgi:uncharacterized protein
LSYNMAPNPFLLAADSPHELLPLLQSNPSVASSQDAHGYSLLHAAASYNHLDLLRALVHDFGVDVNLKDEDGDTALFVVESVEAARVLVEELGIDINVRSKEDGKTAQERIEAEGDFPGVADYLKDMTKTGQSGVGATGKASSAVEPAAVGEPTNGDASAIIGPTPHVPQGLDVSIGSMPDPSDPSASSLNEPDPELRRRIEELAARDDFHTEAGQAELRKLVEEAVSGNGPVENGRNIRQRRE